MTNTTIISDEITQFATETNKIIFNNIASSAAKALYIDFPLYFLTAPSLVGALGKTATAGTTYEIRTQVKNLFNYFKFSEYISEITSGHVNGNFISGATAGLIGGAFKYYVTGQNPIIGALNNAAYETCNNIDLCANNKIVNIAFTITVEALDAAAQTYLKAASGNVIGSAYRALEGGINVAQKLTTLTELLKKGVTSEPIEMQKLLPILSKIASSDNGAITNEVLNEIILAIPTKSSYSALKEGAMVGLLISSTVYGAYIPALELADPEYNVVRPYFNSTLDMVGTSISSFNISNLFNTTNTEL